MLVVSTVKSIVSKYTTVINSKYNAIFVINKTSQCLTALLMAKRYQKGKSLKVTQVSWIVAARKPQEWKLR